MIQLIKKKNIRFTFKNNKKLNKAIIFGIESRIEQVIANLLENALLFLILSFLLETVGNITTLAIAILGDVFLISRIFHAYGITREGASSIFRALGTIGSLIVLITQSIWGFIISIGWLVNNNWGL